MTLFTPHPPQPSPQSLNCQEVGEPTPLDSEGRDPATTSLGWPCCRPSAIIRLPWFPSSDTHRPALRCRRGGKKHDDIGCKQERLRVSSPGKESPCG